MKLKFGQNAPISCNMDFNNSFLVQNELASLFSTKPMQASTLDIKSVKLVFKRKQVNDFGRVY